MSNASSINKPDGSLARDLRDAITYYLPGRRALIVIAALAIAGGVALKWDWLVAAGISSTLLALLPCAIMCVLGLCMRKMSGGSSGCCATDSVQPSRSQVAEFPHAERAQPEPSPAAFTGCHETAASTAQGAVAEQDAQKQPDSAA